MHSLLLIRQSVLQRFCGAIKGHLGIVLNQKLIKDVGFKVKNFGFIFRGFKKFKAVRFQVKSQFITTNNKMLCCDIHVQYSLTHEHYWMCNIHVQKILRILGSANQRQSRMGHSS